MKMNGDVMMMSPLADGLTIPAGGSVSPGTGWLPRHADWLAARSEGGRRPTTSHSNSANAGSVTLTVPIYATEGSFEDANEESPAEPVTVGDLTLTGIWTRMAPMLVEGSPMAMPDGSPEATPDM